MKSNYVPSKGFTLIEMMVVVAIVAVLALLAVPNYQNYIIKTKRTDMMAEMQNIASQIEARKLAAGSYSQVKINDMIGNFPRTGTALYTIAITPSEIDAADNILKLTDANWVITSTPLSTGQLKNDGTLTLNYKGIKCRAGTCGLNKEWND